MSHRFTHAIARTPAECFAQGLTTASLGAPDLDRTLQQHAAYCNALRGAGLDVTVLDTDAALPDCTFVEDTAIVSNGRAIVTRPGAPSRLNETTAIERTLRSVFERVDRIEEPGTVDGGDVCESDDRAYIGLSHRTNREGAEQLAAWLQRAGLPSTIVDIRDVSSILHLKSGLAYVGDSTFVAIDALRRRLDLPGRTIVPNEDEAYAANCVRVNDVVLFPKGYPRLQGTLQDAGFTLRVLDVSEYRKMDGGLSCLSIRF